tara:strand:- start:1083 stop:1340 length:258 start_codon:yes stop_codon:yes gene_type:complete
MTTLTETDVQTDLSAVTDQLTKLVEEMNKVNQAREQLITQVQNLNGVAMYLRGKLPPEEETPDVPTIVQDGDSIERSNEYPANDL